MMHVYFIRAVETGHIKIGISADPERRRCVLERVMPLHLELVATIAVPSKTRRKDAQAAEAVLHSRFSSARFKGEWFRPEPELLTFIEQAAAQPQVAA